MSLEIYTDLKYVPDNMRVITNNDSYFRAHTKLIDSELTRLILSNIDKAEYNSDLTFIGRSKKLGALNKEMLSTGTKILLNILSDSTVCFDVTECGENALRILPKIKNGSILWKCPVLTSVDYDVCDISLNGKNHFNSFSELQDYVIENRGVDL